MPKQDNIAAIATPLGAGGIGVIRVSGPDALQIVSLIFRPAGSRRVKDMPGYTSLLGAVYEGDTPLDEAVLTVFRGPKSYTGEDVAELSCHGGVYILQRVLRLCLDSGARHADPGEFTRRAFMAGKISLAQAEAVIDLISAEGEQAARAAMTAKEGALSKSADRVIEALVAQSAHIAAWSDYPEEDLIPIDREVLGREIRQALSELRRLLSTFDQGRILREGVETAIIGRPNVGKSTLMNLLAGVSRSIVTDQPGTTRDIVEEQVRVRGIILRLADTAGIRDTGDPVERIGVELARKRLESCQLVLLVLDASQPLSAQDQELLELAAGRPLVAVVNKVDLKQALNVRELAGKASRIVEISAVTGEGADALADAIFSVLELERIDTSAPMVVNERQRQCVSNAARELEEAAEALELGFPLDAVSVCLDAALDQLLRLTGKKASEAVLDEVFSRFCVGK